jgi:transcriptional regulator with XRE-family HTH domain
MSEQGFPQFPNENFVGAWRDRRGLTQAKLAEKIGTTGSVVSLLEAGHRQLSPKWLRRISAALEVPVGYLLEHHPDDVPTDLLEIWAEVPKAKREDALNILRSLSGRQKTGTG